MPELARRTKAGETKYLAAVHLGGAPTAVTIQRIPMNRIIYIVGLVVVVLLVLGFFGLR
jgi:hypothetical protein